LAALLVAQPTQLHSWRGFWLLLLADSRAAFVLYAVLALATMIVAALSWQKPTDANLRMSSLIASTVTSSPHLYSYDLVALVAVWMWLVEWYLGRPDLPAALGRTLYAGFLTPLLGLVASVSRIQLTTLCLTLVLGWIWRRGSMPDPSPSGPHVS